MTSEKGNSRERWSVSELKRFANTRRSTALGALASCGAVPGYDRIRKGPPCRRQQRPCHGRRTRVLRTEDAVGFSTGGRGSAFAAQLGTRSRPMSALHQGRSGGF